MEQIINEQSLKEDVIEGIANYLELEINTIEPYITNKQINLVLDKMFEAESEIISDLSLWIEINIKEKDGK